MLRPKRMSKVSVTGAKAVMPSVVESIHDLNLVHLSDYDGSWEGFDAGIPQSGADDASEELVTVRSLQSMLGVTEDDAGPTRVVTRDALEEELPGIREAVNDLDDRRTELEEELNGVEERIDNAEPFVDLGIDLDLLSGYDSLEVAVGEGDAAAVERALADADGVRQFQTESGEETVAAFVYPSEGAEDVLDDALVGVDFGRLAVPDAEGSPEEYVTDLERERADLESDLEDVEVVHAGFLLAAEIGRAHV